MKEIYTIDDIKQFLFREGYFWDGNKLGNPPRPPHLEYLKIEETPIYLFNKNSQKICLHLKVDEIEFSLFNCEYDWEGRFDGYYPFLVLTKDWQKYLLQKYKENYSKLIKDYVKNKKQQIKENLETNLIPLKLKANKLKEEAKKELKELEELKSLVTNLNDSQEF